MTQEEAIKVLRTESVEIGGNAVSVCRFWEALDMATKALEDVTDKDVGRNEPLTLDELRQMDGEPVWCVSLGAELSRGNGWYIGVNNWFMNGYGKTWLAYRQKPEEDDHEQ